MILRPYQEEAVEAVYRHLRERDDNPCVVIPTAGGKTPVMAAICRDAVGRWGGRVLILAHVKELLEQAVEKLHQAAPEMWHQIGVYSAGLKSRDTEHPIIVAGIQSVYRRACQLDRFDLVVVDEAHMLPPDGEGMYQTFLSEALVVNPNLRVIGLTATPFRMTTGAICGPENLLNAVCYEIGVRELIVQGYLCPMITKGGRDDVDTDGVHVRAGEFLADELEALMDTESLVESACAEITEYTRDRRSCLVFATGVSHANHVAETLRRAGGDVATVFGDTADTERARAIEDFRAGRLKYLVNVNVLTLGFDAPNVDCVAMLRPTMSPGLYYQMCLDMETEVLTKNGWASCHDICRGDFVAGFDMKTGRIEWCCAQEKVLRPLAAGETMYGVQAPHIDIRVTDRHEIVYRGRGRSCKHWRKREAHSVAALKDNFHIPVAGRNDGSGLPLSDDEIRFLGWAMTDGHHNPQNNTIVISQSSASPHNAAIRSVLDGCGFGYRVYPVKRKGELARYADGLQYVVPFGKPRGVNCGKRGWRHLSRYFWNCVNISMEDISQRQLALMLEAMNLADGSKPSNLAWKQGTMHIAIGPHAFLADQLQSLLVRRGFRCNVSRQRQRSPWNPGEPRDLHILHVRKQTVATVGGTNPRPSNLVRNRCSLKPVPFVPGEMVWCLTTEFGTLVTRRNGKVAILGNCGRGLRLCEDKDDCLVLDFGGNVLRHGPVDDIRIRSGRKAGDGNAPAKKCPECQALIATGYSICPQCVCMFPPPERQMHDAKATTAGILSGQVTFTEHAVDEVRYSVHAKRDAPPGHPMTMRVEYRVGWQRYVSDFVCVEHTGFARNKAEAWWRARSDVPLPKTAEEAVSLARGGALCQTRGIKVRSVTGEKYDRVVGYELGEKPQYREPGWDEAEGAAAVGTMVQESDDVPF